jgi:hypothetical protein
LGWRMRGAVDGAWEWRFEGINVAPSDAFIRLNFPQRPSLSLPPSRSEPSWLLRFHVGP